MTRDSDLKRIIRTRMSASGENYTTARAALLAERATDPALLRPPTVTPSETAGPSPEPAVDPVRARAEHERLLRPFLRAGRLLTVPSRRRPRFAVLLELLARFAPTETYTEREVGEILGAVHEDTAFWRRELIDYGLLERDSREGTYWVTRTSPARTGNIAQEVTDWERVWLPAFLAGRLSQDAEPTASRTRPGEGPTVEESRAARPASPRHPTQVEKES